MKIRDVVQRIKEYRFLVPILIGTVILGIEVFKNPLHFLIVAVSTLVITAFIFWLFARIDEPKVDNSKWREMEREITIAYICEVLKINPFKYPAHPDGPPDPSLPAVHTQKDKEFWLEQQRIRTAAFLKSKNR